MPNPTGSPGVSTGLEEYVSHLRFDGVGPNPAANVPLTQFLMENLLGHRSGVGVNSPWGTAPTLKPSAYQDSGSGGTVTYTATTLTDTAKAWKPADRNLGGTVTYGAATVTDSARAWGTNMFAGQVVVTATGKMGVVASNTGTVITLAANWLGGTPAASEQYTVFPLSWIGRQIITATGKTGIIAFHSATVATLTAAGWTGGTPAGAEAYIIGPTADPGKHVDDWWKELRMRGNTDVE